MAPTAPVLTPAYHFWKGNATFSFEQIVVELFTTSSSVCPVVSYEFSNTDATFSTADTHITAATTDVLDRTFNVDTQDNMVFT